MSTVPERLASIENTLNRLDHTINGNGQPGLAQKVEKYITTQCLIDNRVKSIEDNHKNNKLDWQWLITALIGVGALIIAIAK